MQRCAAMVAASALFLVVALAVLEPAAGFTGPNALLPLRASSQAAVPLRSTRQCTRMQMEEPKAVQTFKRRASSFLAGLYVTSALVTGTPAIVQPSYAAGAAVEESEQAAETAGKKAKAAAERAKAAKKQLEKDVKAAEAQAKAEEKAAADAKKKAENEKKKAAEAKKKAEAEA